MPENDDLALVVVGLLNELISLKKADKAAHTRITEADDRLDGHNQSQADLGAKIGNLAARVLTLENHTGSTDDYFYITDAGKIFAMSGSSWPVQRFGALDTMLQGGGCKEISIRTVKEMGWPLE